MSHDTTGEASRVRSKRGPWPLFWSEKYKTAKQKHVFNNIFVTLGGVLAQAVANPELTLLKLIKIINTVCSENHKTIVDEFNQTWSPKGVIFAKKSQNFTQRL